MELPADFLSLGRGSVMTLHLNGLKAKQGLMDLRNIKAKNVVLGLIL